MRKNMTSPNHRSEGRRPRRREKAWIHGRLSRVAFLIVSCLLLASVLPLPDRTRVGENAMVFAETVQHSDEAANPPDGTPVGGADTAKAGSDSPDHSGEGTGEKGAKDVTELNGTPGDVDGTPGGVDGTPGDADGTSGGVDGTTDGVDGTSGSASDTAAGSDTGDTASQTAEEGKTELDSPRTEPEPVDIGVDGEPEAEAQPQRAPGEPVSATLPIHVLLENQEASGPPLDYGAARILVNVYNLSGNHIETQELNADAEGRVQFELSSDLYYILIVNPVPEAYDQDQYCYIRLTPEAVIQRSPDGHFWGDWSGELELLVPLLTPISSPVKRVRVTLLEFSNGDWVPAVGKGIIVTNDGPLVNAQDEYVMQNEPVTVTLAENCYFFTLAANPETLPSNWGMEPLQIGLHIGTSDGEHFSLLYRKPNSWEEVEVMENQLFELRIYPPSMSAFRVRPTGNNRDHILAGVGYELRALGEGESEELHSSWISTAEDWKELWLEEGEYKLYETQLPEDFLPMDPSPLRVKSEGGSVYVFGRPYEGTEAQWFPVYDHVFDIRHEVKERENEVLLTIVKTAGGGELASMLAGATLRLTELESGQVVDMWETARSGHAVWLKRGVPYLLQEVFAPQGFTLARDMRFKIDRHKYEWDNVEIDYIFRGDEETGEYVPAYPLSHRGLEMHDNRASVLALAFQKLQPSGETLSGASFRLEERRELGGEVYTREVASWSSAAQPHRQELSSGREYLLSETAAPEGYKARSPIRMRLLGMEVERKGILFWDDASKEWVESLPGIRVSYDFILKAPLILIENSLESYRVYYHGNGADSGEEPKDEQSRFLGSEVVLMAPGDLGRSGFHFVGWNSAATTYAPGDRFMMPGQDVHLYAKWAANSAPSESDQPTTPTAPTVPTVPTVPTAPTAQDTRPERPAPLESVRIVSQSSRSLDQGSQVDGQATRLPRTGERAVAPMIGLLLLGAVSLLLLRRRLL